MVNFMRSRQVKKLTRMCLICFERGSDEIITKSEFRQTSFLSLSHKLRSLKKILDYWIGANKLTLTSLARIFMDLKIKIFNLRPQLKPLPKVILIGGFLFLACVKYYKYGIFTRSRCVFFLKH